MTSSCFLATGRSAHSLNVRWVISVSYTHLRAHENCLAELDYVRHNVQTGTSIKQRTLREWAERPVAKKHDDVMWRLEQWHRQRTRPPPRNYAAFRALATVSLLVAFLILHSVC